MSKLAKEIAEGLDKNVCLKSYDGRADWLSLMSSVESIIAAKLEPVRDALQGLIDFIECEPGSESGAQDDARRIIARMSEEE